MKASRFWIEEKDSEETRSTFSSIDCSRFVAARPKTDMMAVMIVNFIVTTIDAEYKAGIILSQIRPEVRRFVQRLGQE